MTVRASVTPEVMSWARITARLELAEAAARIGRPITDIAAWEEGSLQPTMPQARKAAEVYKRPLAVFYLPEPPQGWQVLRDFRTLPVDREREYSTPLAFLLRETQYRQQWMREYLIDEGYDALELIGSRSIATPAQTVAEEIRKTLKTTMQDLRGCDTRLQALNLWIERAEEAGIFVFRNGNIDCEEARGFTLCDEYAPFIFLNSNDAKAAQIFTLAHELVHLWINATGLSNLESNGLPPDDDAKTTEVYCNRVAGLIVLDSNDFNGQWASQPTDLPIESRIENLSTLFKVSREVVARRLLDRRIIAEAKYEALRKAYREEWIERREEERRRAKEQKGGPSYYLMQVIKNGYAFTRAVLGAYYSGSVSGRETSGLLNVKLNNLSKLADKAGVFAGAYRGQTSE